MQDWRRLHHWGAMKKKVRERSLWEGGGGRGNEENEADARGKRICEGSKELLVGCEL